MGKTLKPGTPAPASAQYVVVNPNGTRTNIERTVVRDKPLPPPPKPGQVYVIADRTRNNAGRGK